MQKSSTLLIILATLVSLFSQAGEVLIKDGESLAFMGDSITQYGASSPSGYVRLVGSGLAANGINVKVIPAGISGHKSNQMLERLDKDVISKAPTWMTLSCGVNDVWHGSRGVNLEDYKVNITKIVDQCQAAGIKVMILTSTQIGLPLTNANNTKLAGYNAFLRELAKERNLPLADLSADMDATHKSMAAAGDARKLTRDGVHMNYLGDLMMAKGVLRAFGLDDAQIATATAAWNLIPNAVPLKVDARLSIPEMEALEAIATARKTSVEKLAAQQLEVALKALLAEGAKDKAAK